MIRDKLLSWRIAQVRHTFVAWVVLPFKISEAFWTTWSSVMFPKGEKE